MDYTQSQTIADVLRSITEQLKTHNELEAAKLILEHHHNTTTHTRQQEATMNRVLDIYDSL